MGSLKSFIRHVRSAKTLKDERNVIQKESAKIRSAFRDNKASSSSKRENIAKLLYLFTLGERTHFGQVECVKLLASPKFTDKRLGYLGTMLLLDENQEVLMLVTNSIDNDMNHPNQYVVCAALTTLANIASTAMARDLFQGVEKLMLSSNPYIRKNAAMCALRIIRKVPDYEEVFIEPALKLLSDTNHGVLLSACSLATDMIDNNPELVDHFAPHLPEIISTLKQISSTYMPEYDIGGICDPFLQCKFIRLLRAIGQDREELSEQMSDILAYIATNTDNLKNIGNSVLYECVLTIFGIETGPPSTDSGLRILGINILAKFLTTKSINTKYSALNTLLRVVELEPTAVQRHRQTILDLIYDADVSIRRRALELTYVLINPSNVRLMVKELLVVLESCDSEFKPQLVFQIALNAERFAPSVRWHIDTLMRLLELAGNYTKENVLSAVILLVIKAPDLHLYATQYVYAALKKSLDQEGLNIVALWLIGEYCDVLLKHGDFTPENEETSTAVNDHEIINLVLKLLNSQYASNTVKEYGINCLVKLTSRLKDAGCIEKARVTIEMYEKSLNIEIQQRAVEYSLIVGEGGQLRKGILGRMPAPEFGEDLEAQHAKAMQKALIRRRRRPVDTNALTKVKKSATSDLLDLGGTTSSPEGTAPTEGQGASDLLNDIFGSTGPSEPAAKSDLSSILGNLSTNEQSATSATDPPHPSPTQQSAAPSDAITAFENEHIKLQLKGSSEGPGKASIMAYFTAVSPISDVSMQVALPKSLQLSLQAIKQSELSTGQETTQSMSVSGNEGAKIKLRLRIGYKNQGIPVLEQMDFDKFPQLL